MIVISNGSAAIIIIYFRDLNKRVLTMFVENMNFVDPGWYILIHNFKVKYE